VLKDFIRSNVSVAALDEKALILAGLPQADIDNGVSAIAFELGDYFARAGLPGNLHFGLAFAAAEMVRERIASMQSCGAGCA
jgi:hypothetical protein